ncbi:MAG: BrnT family toxin [Gammaproteobacteria bacterium]|nr:BrnT family toxin [Gammaproteobacteria bacterium]MBP9729083.1 BrnT family toxin [Gammaproteobacteria bacterium]
MYPEQRFVAIGYLEGRLHVLFFTAIKGEIRVISFRKANLREVKRYEKAITNQ